MAEMDLNALARVQEDSYRRARQGVIGSWPRDSALSPVALGALLEQRRYCVLATTSPAGRPAARPVAFTVVGSSFWFATVAGARLRNLERTPWASVVIEEGDGEAHRAVAVDGPVTIVSGPPPGLLEIWRERHGSAPTWAVAWLELAPHYLVSHSARHGSA
jgi:nitroimidazol reductase NimA-like FMN-containing flavoprotein (pyridoxamine 5'-phosphate oxidase superfamily)